MPPLIVALLMIVACKPDAGPSRTRKPPRAGSGSAAPAPVEARIAAIGDTSYLSPELQRAFDPAGDFLPMPEPGPNDWLAEHPEPPQTFDQFLRADTHVPGGGRTVIYLLPIGEFSASAPALTSLSAIVHAFFTLEVRILPAVPLSELAATTRINEATHKRQLLAPDVLAWLAKRLPEDAFGLVAVTMEDLYPDPKWNFVYGMASLHDRVGVQSFARQDPAFFGEPREAGWQMQLLRRASWTLVHETSHMFGLTHCVFWRCVIAGANHQAEADRSPLHLCPVDLRKLQSSIRFDPAKRETALAATLRELGIDDEAAWSERRARWIRDGTR
jgi:archaemetzincin